MDLDTYGASKSYTDKVSSGLTGVTNSGTQLVFTTTQGTTFTVTLTGLSDNNFTTILKQKLEGLNDTLLNLFTMVDGAVYFNGKELLTNEVTTLTNFYNKTEIDDKLNLISTSGVDLTSISDGTTITVVGNKLVATTLDGLTVSIATLNGITNYSSAMRFKTSVATKAALVAITTHTSGDVYVVDVDESRSNGRYTYVYGEDGTWICLGATSIDISTLVPVTRKINNKSLTGDVTLTASDLGISTDLSGDIKITARATAPTGWIMCDGSAISRTTYSDLFTAIGTSWGIGDGSTTFNVPDMRDRTPIGAGQATFVSRFAYTDVNITTDVITVINNDSLITGTPVVLTTTGTVPTGLISGTTYYVIRVSATTIKLATSLANAVAGTAINITAQGTGTHILTVTYTNRTLGSIGGEETHILSSAEISHSHGVSKTNVGDFNNNFNVVNNVSGTTLSNVAANNMQPYAAVNYIIKY